MKPKRLTPEDFAGMAHCQYEVETLADGTFRHTCAGGNVRLGTQPVWITTCTCPLAGALQFQQAHPEKCGHRGEETRRVKCNTCAGETLLKVFACPVRGECTIGKQVKGVAAVCQTCPSYQQQSQPSASSIVRPPSSPKSS